MGSGAALECFRLISSSRSCEIAADGHSKALLCFENVSLRYQPGLPLALEAVTFQVHRRERVAVVGRTGSGKSTLAVALFRLCPVEQGRVLLQGQDLAQLPLDTARRAMGIITQDPVIFSGTVQYNLDPFGEFDEKSLTRH